MHKVAAVGSRSVDSAQNFINTVAEGDKSIKAYGSYEQVYADKVSFGSRTTTDGLTDYPGRGRHLHWYV